LKLKYQIFLSQGLLVFLSVLIIVLNIGTLSSMENDANIINLSGKLRALSYKMAYLLKYRDPIFHGKRCKLY